MRLATILLGVVWLSTGLVAAADPVAPIDLGPGNTQGVGINYASATVTYPDGTLESFARRSHAGHVSIFRVRSIDHGMTWDEPEVLLNLPVAPWGGPMPLLDQEGELHFVIPRVRGEGRNPAIDRFIDLYHIRSTDGQTAWTEPQRIFEGYCGAIQGLFQLSNGRIIAPFADWIGGRPRTPPTGPSETTCVYSDNGGHIWHESPSRLTAPCFDGYNGGNYGACEPTLIELLDHRNWMLIRTQAGKLYESFSADGAEWSDAVPSPFYSSNSPAFPIRLPDDRIVVFWNNCQMPPRVNGDGVYGGRDALHAAISNDDGATWQGFREAYRDPTRNGTPPKHGDRGTAYPHATLTGEGNILLVSGQGQERRRRFLIDPDWLLEREVEADMTSLEEWHVFKGFGPAAGFWRDRTAGPQLVTHPDEPEASRLVLHIRRPDELDPDGATWNFPAATAGILTVRLRIAAGFGGAQISLTDRLFDPCDDVGEEEATFSVTIDPQYRITEHDNVSPSVWHTLQMNWDGSLCKVSVDGKLISTLKVEDPPENGLSYVRFRSRAEEVDQQGFYVESVKIEVAEN